MKMCIQADLDATGALRHMNKGVGTEGVFPPSSWMNLAGEKEPPSRAKRRAQTAAHRER